MNRAERRRRTKVKHNKRKKYAKDWWLDPSANNGYHMIQETPTLCSCSMCGNPRKYYGIVTLQEVRQNAKDKADSQFDWFTATDDDSDNLC